MSQDLADITTEVTTALDTVREEAGWEDLARLLEDLVIELADRPDPERGPFARLLKIVRAIPKKEAR